MWKAPFLIKKQTIYLFLQYKLTGNNTIPLPKDHQNNLGFKSP